MLRDIGIDYDAGSKPLLFTLKCHLPKWPREVRMPPRQHSRQERIDRFPARHQLIELFQDILSDTAHFFAVILKARDCAGIGA